MNEEKTVLEFFARTDNLPLALSVASQMDVIREQMNSRFWHELQKKLDTLFYEHAPEWQTQVTEDRNTADMLVGLQGKLREPQALCLFPMMEQQYIGGTWRIFYGLMWQGTPTMEHLPAASQLKKVLGDAGFKNNENFLAWQWTDFYPRSRDFLLRFALQPEQLISELESLFRRLSLDQRALINQANAALKGAPPSKAISLDQLRRNKRAVLRTESRHV